MIVRRRRERRSNALRSQSGTIRFYGPRPHRFIRFLSSSSSERRQYPPWIHVLDAGRPRCSQRREASNRMARNRRFLCRSGKTLTIDLSLSSRAVHSMRSAPRSKGEIISWRFRLPNQCRGALDTWPRASRIVPRRRSGNIEADEAKARGQCRILPKA